MADVCICQPGGPESDINTLRPCPICHDPVRVHKIIARLNTHWNGKYERLVTLISEINDEVLNG